MTSEEAADGEKGGKRGRRQEEEEGDGSARSRVRTAPAAASARAVPARPQRRTGKKKNGVRRQFTEVEDAIIIEAVLRRRTEGENRDEVTLGSAFWQSLVEGRSLPGRSVGSLSTRWFKALKGRVAGVCGGGGGEGEEDGAVRVARADAAAEGVIGSGKNELRRGVGPAELTEASAASPPPPSPKHAKAPEWTTEDDKVLEGAVRGWMSDAEEATTGGTKMTTTLTALYGRLARESFPGRTPIAVQLRFLSFRKRIEHGEEVVRRRNGEKKRERSSERAGSTSTKKAKINVKQEDDAVGSDADDEQQGRSILTKKVKIKKEDDMFDKDTDDEQDGNNANSAASIAKPEVEVKEEDGDEAFDKDTDDEQDR